MARHPVFFTRKFPPSVGGMETLAAGVWSALSQARPEARLIAYGGPNRGLPLWLPGAVGRLLWLIARRRVDVVLTGDALTFAIVSPMLRLFRLRHATMVMGLDLTFENHLYRAVVHPPLRRADAVLAISSATADEAAGFGVPPSRITVVRLGLQAPAVAPHAHSQARARLSRELGLAEDDTIVLTLGRLVRRKGGRWFVGEVLPRLASTVHYVLAGDGPEHEQVLAAAHRSGVASRVHLLGRVSDEQREVLMQGADVFVQPNVAVQGDMEGFGLVTVEAALRGTPVVAADLEGIKDAVIGGRTGILLPSQEPELWAQCLTDLLNDLPALERAGRRFQQAAGEVYGAQAMAASLLGALDL